jgi:hypothetical protein
MFAFGYQLHVSGAFFSLRVELVAQITIRYPPVPHPSLTKVLIARQKA